MQLWLDFVSLRVLSDESLLLFFRHLFFLRNRIYTILMDQSIQQD